MGEILEKDTLITYAGRKYSIIDILPFKNLSCYYKVKDTENGVILYLLLFLEEV